MVHSMHDELDPLLEGAFGAEVEDESVQEVLGQSPSQEA
jgi:hypothetical protein